MAGVPEWLVSGESYWADKSASFPGHLNRDASVEQSGPSRKESGYDDVSGDDVMRMKVLSRLVDSTNNSPGQDEEEEDGRDFRPYCVYQPTFGHPTGGHGFYHGGHEAGSSMSLRAQKSFLEKAFQKRDCIHFIPSAKDASKCGCGRSLEQHTSPFSVDRSAAPRWTISRHTVTQPTDAYGTIEFQGGPHPHKAQYVRLGFDSDPEQILYLLEKVWGIERPKLVISVHGGIANFGLQPKLARVFRKGLLKGAKTTGAWIITSGLNVGVVRHVAAALNDGGGLRTKKKIVTIGIAPWGLLKRRDDFVGKEVTVPYHPQAFSPKGKFAVLNDKHSYFLLVDNGTVGRYGADIILRKRFEEYISKLKIETSGKRVPVVCVVLEGGTCTIRAVLDYVTNVPPVPVVVCDGSGRAADLLAFTHQYAQDDGTMPEPVRDQLLCLIQQCFGYTPEQAEKVFMELMLCVRKKHLITVFRLGEDSQQDIDHAILTALLKGQDLSAPDQLSLALTWNRPDIARCDIFVYGQEWPPGSLESAMMDALIYDRVEFVKLLLENGVSMEKFLTIQRLEALYNTDKGPSYSVEALKLIIRDVVKYPIRKGHRISLHEVGLVLQKLMGGAFRAPYLRKDFKRRCEHLKYLHKQSMQEGASGQNAANGGGGLSSPLLKNEGDDDAKSPSSGGLWEEAHFTYPFNELLIWSVLMRRQKMALCMWQHGEEALAKGLVATKLYHSMAKEAGEDYLEVDICDELRAHSQEFSRLSLDLLEVCYEADDDLTFQLLTYELSNWGNETCLSLAWMANHMAFVAHPGCQILLADLWHGGLRIRRNSNWKVIMGLLMPPTILALNFKTKDELLLQPQTKEEHFGEQEEDHESDSGSASGGDDNHQVSDSSDAGGSSSDGSADNSDVENGLNRGASSRLKRRKNTVHGSRASLTSNILKNLASPKFARSLSIHSDRGRHHKSSANGPLSSLRHSAGMNHAVAQLSPSKLARLGHSVIPDLRSPESQMRKRPLKMGKKFYEFYVAPITTFWSFTIAYILFLLAYTFIVLVKTPPEPSYPEIFVISFVFVQGCELIRKLFMADPPLLSLKVRVFLSAPWNVTSSIAVIMFLVGFILRIGSPKTLAYGRVIYCANVVYWYIHSLDLLSVNKYLGPYITMVAKMVVTMVYMCTILMVVLISYGVLQQSIRFPNNEFSWNSVRNIFFHPYFMLYGEVYAPEIDLCGDENQECTPGHFLNPLFMSAFLLVANILLINLLIAAFNNIFQSVNAISKQVWKFQRYRVVMEYEQKPWLPPPLSLISHLWLIYKFILRRNWQKREYIDYGLKLFLSEEDVEKLHDFEEECVEELYRNRDLSKFTSQEERIRRTADRAEFMSMKIDDLTQKYNASKVAMQGLEAKAVKMLEMQQQMMTTLQSRFDTLASGLLQGSHGGRTPTPPTSPGVSPQRTVARSMSQTTTAADAVADPVALLRVQQARFPSIEEEQGACGTPSPPGISGIGQPSSPDSPAPPDSPFPFGLSRPRPKRTLSLKSTFKPKTGESGGHPVNVPTFRELHSASPDYAVPPLSPLVQSESNHEHLLSAPESHLSERSASVPGGSTVTPNRSPVLLNRANQRARGGSLTNDKLFLRSESTPVGTAPQRKTSLASTRRLPPIVRRTEYTTITDSIDTSCLAEEEEPTPIPLTVNSARSSMAFDFDSPNPQQLMVGGENVTDTGLVVSPGNLADSERSGESSNKEAAANDKNNEILKEYEEYGAMLTAGLQQRRLEATSVGSGHKLSVCLTNIDDLKEMGLDELELKDYAAVLERSNSSSNSSLNSTHLEDQQGFVDIANVLVEQEVSKAAAAAHSRRTSRSQVSETQSQRTSLASLDSQFDPDGNLRGSASLLPIIEGQPVMESGRKFLPFFSDSTERSVSVLEQIVEEERPRRNKSLVDLSRNQNSTDSGKPGARELTRFYSFRVPKSPVSSSECQLTPAHLKSLRNTSETAKAGVFFSFDADDIAQHHHNAQMEQRLAAASSSED